MCNNKRVDNKTKGRNTMTTLNPTDLKQQVILALHTYVAGECFCDFSIFIDNVGGIDKVKSFINNLVNSDKIQGLTNEELTQQYIAPFVNQYI